MLGRRGRISHRATGGRRQISGTSLSFLIAVHSSFRIQERPGTFGGSAEKRLSSAERHGSFEERYVAFVDILGFRDIVKRMQADHRLFLTVRDALKAIDMQAREFRDYRVAKKQSHQELIARGKVPLSDPPQLQMTSFSDCYVISETSPAWHVVAGVQALGADLLAQGILCRGAIVKGPAYHRDRVLFGPAVIDAYELESQVAKYPRILVTEPVRKATWAYHEGRWNRKLFIQDTDGCWFINVLTPSMSEWGPLSKANADLSNRRYLHVVGKWLRHELLKSRNDLGRLSKLQWLGNHFNRIARERGKLDLIEFPESSEDDAADSLD